MNILGVIRYLLTYFDHCFVSKRIFERVVVLALFQVESRIQLVLVRDPILLLFSILAMILDQILLLSITVAIVWLFSLVIAMEVRDGTGNGKRPVRSGPES